MRFAIVTLLLASVGCGGVYMHEDGWMIEAAAERGGDNGGERGVINPKVLEYVLMSPDAPFVAYYRALAAHPEKAPFTRLDFDDTRTFAARLTPGGRVTPRLMARARVERIISPLEQSFADEHGPGGAAAIFCCATLDRETGEVTDHQIVVNLIINRSAQVVRMMWRDGITVRNLTWDLSALPGAFDSNATLSEQAISRAIRPLHPVQEVD